MANVFVELATFVNVVRFLSEKFKMATFDVQSCMRNTENTFEHISNSIGKALLLCTTMLCTQPTTTPIISTTNT